MYDVIYKTSEGWQRVYKQVSYEKATEIVKDETCDPDYRKSLVLSILFEGKLL